MKQARQTITQAKVILWYILINIPLLAIPICIHHLLSSAGGSHGTGLAEATGLWLLVAFKVIGANLILAGIFSDYKTIRP